MKPLMATSFRDTELRTRFWGNVFGAYTFAYNVHGFRMVHVKHHDHKIFLTAEDMETAPFEAPRSRLLNGFIGDLILVSAFRLLLLKNRPDARDTLQNRIFRRLPILLHMIVLWGTLSYFGSVWYVVVFFATFAILYPVSTRLRTWGTHGDLYAKEGMRNSAVVRNVMSPLLERVFIGNRMMMYHYEHHHSPHLTFRVCEKRARQRRIRCEAHKNAPLTLEEGVPIYNVSAPSYFFFVKNFLRRTFVSVQA